MKIYKDRKLISVFHNISDEIGLGEIYLRFYDYNFDGFLDFTIPINSNWEKYYLYNPSNVSFQHFEDWDYLDIQKINKKKKQILSQPDGIEVNGILYQITGNKINIIHH